MNTACPTPDSSLSPWQNFLHTQGAQYTVDGLQVADFGAPEAELNAAAQGTVLVPLTQFGLIDVHGPDAREFLHNQFTNDINHVGPAQVQHAAWCTAKGRMQASFLFWRTPDGYRFTLSADLQAALQKRLQMFILRSKVTLQSRSADRILLGLAGPQAAAALLAAGLPCPDEPLTHAGDAERSVLRLDTQRFIVLVADSDAPALWQTLAATARPAGLAAWQWLDIQAGLPVITAATREEFVPQMADFDKIGGVSFHKGCYPGQEIVARTQYLGKVKRHLFRLGSDVPLAAGDELFSPDNPDQSVGRVVSATPAPRDVSTQPYVALAVVQALHANNLRLKSREGTVLTASAVNP